MLPCNITESRKADESKKRWLSQMAFIRLEGSAPAVAIYHLSLKHVSWNQGRLSVAAASYRSGEILVDELEGRTYDYTRIGARVAHKEIMLADGAPEAWSDRSALWNTAWAEVANAALEVVGRWKGQKRDSRRFLGF